MVSGTRGRLVDAASPPRVRRTVMPLRSGLAVLAVQTLSRERSRVGVPASAGSQQEPSGPRSPFFLKKGVMGTGLKPLNRFRLKAALRPERLVIIMACMLCAPGVVSKAQPITNHKFPWRSWRLGGLSTMCGSPVTPRSGVTGTARPTCRLLCCSPPQALPSTPRRPRAP